MQQACDRGVAAPAANRADAPGEACDAQPVRPTQPTRPTQPAQPVRIEGLRHVYNMRDLGGYPAAGTITRVGRFLRSDAVSDVTSADTERLLGLGLTRVLDLRSEGEQALEPDPFAEGGVGGVAFASVPLYNYNMSDPALDRADAETDARANYLTGGYFQMLSYKYAIRSCFKFIAREPHEGCLLFHCTAGMDRTGILAMLLLGLAGVSREHIICDYLYSFGGVEEVNSFVLGGDEAFWREVERHAGADATAQEAEERRCQGEQTLAQLRMRRDTVSLAYDRLIEVHGSVEAYLRACGLSANELESVRSQLLGEQLGAQGEPQALS